MDIKQQHQCQTSIALVVFGIYSKKYENVIRKGKPIVVAPGMNTTKWEQPLWKQELESVKWFSFTSDDSVENNIYDKRKWNEYQRYGCHSMLLLAILNIWFYACQGHGINQYI